MSTTKTLRHNAEHMKLIDVGFKHAADYAEWAHDALLVDNVGRAEELARQAAEEYRLIADWLGMCERPDRA